MKKIYVERRDELLKVVITENDFLKECFIEKTGIALKGQIYKGVVKNIVPSIKSIFIDIGKRKNAYMYMDKYSSFKNIKKGQELMVEVLKEGTQSKGAKVSTAVTIPGRYTVLDTKRKGITFSKKLNDQKFIEIIQERIKCPEDLGVIIRTNAVSIDLTDIQREIDLQIKKYREILNKFTYSNKPQMLYSNEGVLGRTVRDYINQDVEKILVDTQEDYEFIMETINEFKDIKTSVVLYENNVSLFENEGISNKISKLLNRRIDLDCGGYLIFDRTEAMHVIDVNSGSNVNLRKMKDTIYTTNMQAAREIAKQIRLRNLSGIIVVDFIDVEDRQQKDEILFCLKEGFADDKNKTVVYDFTELNLVQIARRKSGLCIYDYLQEKCDICNGTGNIMKNQKNIAKV